MVRLLKLQTLNFKKTNIDPPLPLPEGVTLVCGPNESGKSTILDAILYALYARVIRPRAVASVEQLISYGKNHSIVRLDFSVGEKVYRVERQLYLNRASTATLWEVLEDGQLRPLASGQKQVSDQIEILLAGISYNEILASTVVAQKDLEHLVKQGPSDRKKVINAFMNLESFNTVLDSLNEERKDLEGTTARPGKLTIEKRKSDEIRNRVDEYNNNLKKNENLDSNVKNLEKELPDLKEREKEADSVYNTLKNFKNAFEIKDKTGTQIRERKKLVDQLQDQLRTIRKAETQIGDVTGELETFADLDEADQKLGALDGAVREIDNTSSLLKQNKKKQQNAFRIVAGLKRKLPATINEDRISNMKPRTRLVWSALAIAIAFFSAAFILLAVGTSLIASVIPMLFGTISILFAARQMFAESKLRAILSDIETLRQRRLELEGLKKDANGFEKERTGLEKRILSSCGSMKRYVQIFSKTKTKGPLALVKELNKALDRDKTQKNILEERLRGLQIQIKEKPSKEEELKRTEASLKELESDLAKIRLPELPRGMSFSDEFFQKASNNRDKTRDDVVRKEGDLKSNRKQLEELTELIEENRNLPNELKNQTDRVNSLEHELNVTKAALTGLENTSEALRSRVKPYVEQYMELVLPAITNGRYRAAELDEDYNLKVWDPDAGEFKSREVFSGGTEDQFLLSMRLAFAVALLPEIKGMHPEFLFLDEPLGSSDDERRHGIVELLGTELSAKFKQIFLISHVGNLEEEVRNVIRLENGQVTEAISG